MALSLLRKVAEKAINTLGGAASSAFNYLQKNTPKVVDTALDLNPGTRLFSQRSQNDMARAGRVLQKAPDTTIRSPQFITPVQTLAQETLTSIPGELSRSVGRTLERVGTPEGRDKIIKGVREVPGQTKELFTGGLKKAPENLGKLFDNPAVEDALNTADLFALGAGTLARAGGKQIVKKAAKSVVGQVAKKGGKDLVEVGGEKAVKTLLKEAAPAGSPKMFRKTKELLRGADDKANRKAAMEYLAKNRAEIPEKPLLSDEDLAMRAVSEARGGGTKPGGRIVDDILEPATSKTKELFQKGTDYARKWINTREGFTDWRATDIKKTPALTQFDKEGMTAILDLQSGKNAGRYSAIKNFTDGLYELENKAGILRPDQYRKNYLPQLWDNTPEEIDAVFKKTVGKDPGFSKSRVIEDYATGIEAGLKPRFNTISDLLSSRYKTAQRALADKELVDNLVRSGSAKTLDKAPVGWEAVDLKDAQGRTLAVDPETAKMIRNYTDEGSPLLAKIAEFVSNAKQTILSAGIPKTGWNFHTGVNVPVRAMAARKNPLGAIVDSVIWNTNPKSAVHYVDKVVPKNITDGLLEQGLTISRSAEDAGYGFKPREGKSLYSKAVTGFDKLFSEAAFDKVLPAHKLKVGWETYEQAIKNGATEHEAFKVAAQTANEIFGGVNPQAMGRSKDFQNIMRVLLLAPDWLESNVRIAGKTGGLLNPANWAKAEYAPYKRFAVNAASMYSSFAMLNKALSGHFPWENGAGQEFNLATGSFDERGRERMIPAFGTAFDFLRIPITVMSSLVNNDPQQAVNIIKNRLSPPVGAAVALASNQDYRGRDITSPDKSMLDNIAGIAGQVGQAVGVPSQVTNTLTFLRGDSTPEELAAGLLEAPLRFRGGAKTPAQRRTAELLKSGGATNKDVNEALTYKPESKSLFGGGYKTMGKTSDGKIDMPKTKKEREAFNKSVDSALESGTTELPDDVIITRFFDGKTYDKSARSGQQDILDKMLKVADDEYLSPEQKAKIANAAKISPADLQLYRTASLDQTDRLEGLLEYASQEHPNRQEFIENLIMGKRSVGGKSMFSTTMYDRLYDEGLITKDEKALITAMKYDPIFNKFYMDRDYKGGDGGASEAKVRAYIKSVNAIFKDPLKVPKSQKISDVEANSTAPKAPKLQFKKAPKKMGTSTSQWFTQY